MKKSLAYFLSALLVIAGVAVLSSSSIVAEELLPPNAKSGECYARVFVPPTYKTVTEQKLKREAGEKIIIEEAKYDIAEEKILVKEASEKLEIVPAQYEWVEEKVLIDPEHTHLESIPPVYETITEKVIDQPAHTVWKKGKGPIQRVDHATGEIMCLVDVPATYKTVKKRVLKQPATTKEVVTPAKYKTVKKQVIKTPPTVRKIEIPAEYTTVKVRKLVTPAQVKKIAIPEEFQTVSKKEMVTEGKVEWQPILCETNTSPGLVTSLQKALKQAGYNPGPIDGALGGQTMAAVQAYQRAKGLPSGQLTIETLSSLNIKF